MSDKITLSGHTDAVSAIAWLGPERLVTGSFDKTIKTWNIKKSAAEKTLSAHQDQVLALAVSASGEWFVSGGKDRKVNLWNAESVDGAKEIANHTKGVHAVAFSADGKLVASCGEDDTRILLWDVEAGKSFKLLTAEDPDDKTQRRSLHALAFRPNSAHLATCGADRTLRLWDLEQGKEIRRFEAAQYQLFTEKENKVTRTAKRAASDFSLYALAFSADGKLLAAGGLEKTIRIWDAESGELRHTIADHPGFVFYLAFTNGNRLISVGHTGQIRIWNPGDGSAIASFAAPSFIHAAAMSPDQAQLAVACADAKGYVVSLPASKG
jgi:WD40 repeat protein